MRRSDYCRLCTKLSSSNVHIFEERGHKLMLHLKILKHSGIVVTEHDPLPKYVCVVCVGKLDFVEKFFTDCQNAQVFFRRDQSWKLNVPSGSNGADCFLENTDRINNTVLIVDDEDDNDKADVNVRDPFDISITEILPHEVDDDCKITEVSVENIIENNAELQKGDGKGTFISNCDEFNKGTLDVKDVETNLEDCLIDDNVIVTSDDLSNKSQCDTESDERNSFSVSKISAVLEKVVTGDVPSQSNSVIDECSPDRGTSVLKISENVINEKEKFLGSSVLLDNRLDASSTIDRSSVCYIEDQNEKADSDDEVSCTQEEFEDDPENSNENSCFSDNGDSLLNVVNKSDVAYVDNTAVTSNIDLNMNDNDENPLNVINKLEVVDSNNKDVTSNIDLYLRNVEKLNMNNLMSESFSRYFDCAENILKGKCSIMPYFIKWPRPGISYRIGFKCFICTRYYYSRKAVIDHLYSHLKLICQFCGVVFRLKTNFKNHLLTKHYSELNNKKLRCSDCDEKFSDINLYLYHAQAHCDYYCGLCPYITKNPNSFLIHIKENHTEDKNNCNDCSLIYFDGEQSFKKHILNIKKEKHVCSSCGMIFHSEMFLKIHYEIYGMIHGSSSLFTEENSSKDNPCNEVKLMNNKEVIKYFQDILSKKIPLEKLQLSKKEVLGKNLSHGFECPFSSCKKVVGRIEERIFRHIQSHLLLICYKCYQLFKDTKRYVNHVQKHVSYSYFSCHICNNIKFDGVTQYISHVRDHICKRVCLHCFEIFSDRNERERHMSKYHKDKIRVSDKICDQCGKKLRDNRALQTHINSSHAIVKINLKKVCPICGKRKSSQCCSLESDVKEKEEFICAYCSKIFHNKLSLETHILAHMNEKRFVCKYCIDKKFNRITSLHKHVKDFHTERKWKCMVNDCSKSFTFKSALETHMKAAHKIGVLR
ncbi:uncharacterized protein LOC142330513 isoform X2 [Lycorma delicatula]|uniref:uncharacterized protein LOC142330513 isoform X2 n=1 Tax=Lycorma delicatula TaxID=130591 RepID=UPI003F51216D